MSNTTVPSKTFTFVSGGAIRASEVNQDFDTLYTEFANVGTANLLDACISTAKYVDASITAAKLVAVVQQALHQTGMMIDYVGTTAPTGWVLADGKTIGNAASAATERANADTSALFTLIYDSMADAQAAVSGGRGASAAADFAANKTIALPDLRGRVVAGKDNMGGTTASRLTAGGSGITGTTNGIAGGSQTHTLVTGELAAHSHTASDSGHTHGVTDPGHVHLFTRASQTSQTVDTVGGGTSYTFGDVQINTVAITTGVTVNSGTANVTTTNTGSGTAHNNTQPTYILTKIIKL